MVLLYVSGCLFGYFVMLSGNMCYLHQHLGVFSLNLVFDSYSYTFLYLLFLISACVLLWSYYYIDLEVAYRRFLSLVVAFLFAIFLLVVFSTLFGCLIGWDGLGVTSFLLVVYFNNRNSLGSGIITAITNRIGDCFLLVLLAVQFSHIFNTHVLTVLVLLTSMTNSAQFPFSSWLPAAMAAPTPVSALVHSSTLVTAGVYILIRFNSAGTEWLLVAGSVTISIAGMCACAEMDLNNIVALSTLSQLGVIMVALSLSMNSLCFFHLITHAIFKALLFISVGVGIHSVYGSQDFRSFSGFCGVSLFPTLSLTVANISLAALPFIAGFYSKDAILETFYNGSHSLIFLINFLVGVGLTTVYSINITLLAFVGLESSGAVNLNGGGASMITNLPLAVLGVASVSGGALLVGYCGAVPPVVVSFDNLCPLLFIAFGIITGVGFANFKYSILSSIWCLTPSFQVISSSTVIISNASSLDSTISAAGASGLLALVLNGLLESLRWVTLAAIFLYLTIAL